MPAVQPRFEEQTVDSGIAIGYGVATGDVDGDGRPDILLADKKQFVWYRNGDWRRFVLAENLTEYDNVCIAARDVDGDGKVEIAVGAQWNPSETSDPSRSGSVHILVRPGDPTQKWDAVRLPHEPTIHRMRWMKAGDGKTYLIVVPLHGRGNRNGEGRGVHVMAFEMPRGRSASWKYTVIDSSMHMTHNFDVAPGGSGSPGEVIILGGREGLKRLFRKEEKWISEFITTEKPFGEVRVTDRGFAGISPMHGNELCVLEDGKLSVLADDLSQGHALAAADVFGSRDFEIIAGWREPDASKKVGIKLFVRSASGPWQQYWIDEGGMACEDLLVTDLNGDGKADIVASGRATGNLKIYWNRN